jgi:hypothetical protein
MVLLSVAVFNEDVTEAVSVAKIVCGTSRSSSSSRSVSALRGLAAHFPVVFLAGGFLSELGFLGADVFRWGVSAKELPALDPALVSSLPLSLSQESFFKFLCETEH